MGAAFYPVFEDGIGGWTDDINGKCLARAVFLDKVAKSARVPMLRDFEKAVENSFNLVNPLSSHFHHSSPPVPERSDRFGYAARHPDPCQRSGAQKHHGVLTVLLPDYFMLTMRQGVMACVIAWLLCIRGMAVATEPVQVELLGPQPYQVVQRQGFDPHRAHEHEPGGAVLGFALVTVEIDLSGAKIDLDDDAVFEYRVIPLVDAANAAAEWSTAESRHQERRLSAGSKFVRDLMIGFWLWRMSSQSVSVRYSSSPVSRTRSVRTTN
jgi:hypothetical protein